MLFNAANIIHQALQPNLILLVSASLALSLPAMAQSNRLVWTPKQQCVVVRVADGDSLEARCPYSKGEEKVRIRLKGIDAPELRQRYGAAAQQELHKLCLYEKIKIPVKAQKDRYNRVLAVIECRGEDVNSHMVANGFAWYYRPTAKEFPRLVKLEQKAQEAQLGLWADKRPTPPWQWKKKQPPRGT